MMKQLAKGAAWMMGFRLAERTLGIVSTIILARLLIPEDFGLVAMAMSIIALIELASVFGFDTTLIRHEDPKRQQFDTAFTLNAVLGLLCGGTMLLCARPTAAFYGEPRLVDLISVLALAWAIQGFENVGTVMFRRDLQFHREFILRAGTRVLSFCATLIAALTLRSYWALIIGMITGRIAMVALSYIMHPYRPRFSLRASRELFSFSVWLFFTNILEFLNNRLSSFVIGRMSGSYSLGLYTIAYEIGTLPTSELLAPVNRAIFPGFARMAHDLDQLRAGFLDVLGVTILFCVPAAFGIAAVAEPLVLVVLSAKWAGVIPLLQVLALLGAAAAITGANISVYYALGRPNIVTALNAAQLVILVPSMIFAGLQFGAIGVAWAELGATLAILPVSIAVAVRVTGIRLSQLASRTWRPVSASILMFVTVRELMIHMGSPPVGPPEVLRLAVGVGVGVAMYIGIVLGLWYVSGRGPGAETRLLDVARAKLAQRLSAEG